MSFCRIVEVPVRCHSPIAFSGQINSTANNQTLCSWFLIISDERWSDRKLVVSDMWFAKETRKLFRHIPIRFDDYITAKRLQNVRADILRLSFGNEQVIYQATSDTFEVFIYRMSDLCCFQWSDYRIFLLAMNMKRTTFLAKVLLSIWWWEIDGSWKALLDECRCLYFRGIAQLERVVLYWRKSTLLCLSDNCNCHMGKAPCRFDCAEIIENNPHKKIRYCLPVLKMNIFSRSSYQLICRLLLWRSITYLTDNQISLGRFWQRIQSFSKVERWQMIFAFFSWQILTNIPMKTSIFIAQFPRRDFGLWANFTRAFCQWEIYSAGNAQLAKV